MILLTFIGIVYRTLLIYLSVLFVMRLMGKREVGQLSTFDLVVAIMIAEVAVFPLEDLAVPLYAGLVPMLVLVSAEVLLSYLCLKFKALRRIVDGCPSVLIFRGEIMDREMRRQRYNINDLMGQLREKNVFNISDVEYAILETTGELTVMVKSTKRPVTLEDLNITPSHEVIPVPLVLDGEVIQENLDYLNLSHSWLEGEFKKRNLTVKDALYAGMDSQGNLFISKKQARDRNKEIILT
ncbi:MAG: DUF421 domain-containing protein [Firmicutes bacterium]|nr:DUF421 domain-containing protein [Bacillota bacterium]